MIRLSLFLILLIQLPLHSQDAVIQKRTSNYEVKSKKLCKTEQFDIQINNRDGESYGDIYIPFTKGDKVSIDYIQIVDLNNNIVRKIKDGEMTVSSSISDISLYEDDLVKFVHIRHNVFPYRVVYSYTVESNKFLTVASLDCKNLSIPILEGELTVSVPTDYPIKYKQINVKQPDIQTTNRNEIYAWNYSYIGQSYRNEKNGEADNDKNVVITVVPTFINYGVKGSLDSWGDLGKWINDLNQNKQDLPISEQQTIDKMLVGIDDPREKTKILYKYLQDNTRYINVSIDHGGLQTYPASYVVSNRYGDCKALTNYMLAMLKHTNIKSFYTLIYAGDKINDFDKNFPSQIFNHVILTVPLDGDSIFLECTSKNSPFNYLGTFTQGRQALLIDNLDSHFVTTPTMYKEDVLCTKDMRVDLTSSIIDIEIVERGNEYERSNFIVNELNKTKQEKYIRDNILSGSYDLTEFRIDSTKDTPSIKIHAKCKMHNFVNRYANNIFVNSLSMDIPTYETPSVRKRGVQLDYPTYCISTIYFDLGAMNIKNLPPTVDLETKYGRYSIEYTLKENNIIEQIKTLIINEGKYSIQEYPSFYQFLSTIKNSDLQNIIFETL